MNNHSIVKALITVKVNYLSHPFTNLIVICILLQPFLILKYLVLTELGVISHESGASISIELCFRMKGNLASFELTFCQVFMELCLA